MKDKEPIITVLGPTATGKTGVAVRIAAELGGEISGGDAGDADGGPGDGGDQ